MTNVQAEVKGNKLILTIDITKDFGPSKSGKTVTVGSTNGFQAIGEGANKVIYSVNVNKKQ